RWFPREDDHGVHDLYCASMFLLLKSWTDLAELKEDHQTFDVSFGIFYRTADFCIKHIISNIQYYHECSTGATEE
ncbi:hypothetical protein L208DRAFT_1215573, partial [Tricholoma matsutake]